MYAIILAGGSGTRLWPLSRAQFPKQFIDLANKGRSIFQETVDRVQAVVPEHRILVVAHRQQRDFINYQLGEMGLKRTVLLQEPLAYNTAPAIGMAAWYLASVDEKNKNAVMAVLPSDHVITPKRDFVEIMKRARQSAEAYGLVTFGIKPTYPETGYGYIYCGQRLDEWTYRVEEFIEKPGPELAEKYLENDRYLWNSGMFVFKIRDLISQYRRYMPSLAAGLDEIEYRYFTNLEQVYSTFDNVSIDYGLLERTTDVTVVPVDIEWSDVGSWDAFYKISPKDENGNCLHGRVHSMDTRNSLAYSPNRLVGLIGVENLAVVATEDAFLVCNREKSQEVRALVDQLEGDGAAEYIVHPTLYFPWGKCTTVVDRGNYKVNKIVVDPGERRSLHSHKRRTEHWLVTKGQALVTVDTEEKMFSEGDYVFVPVNVRHRVENKGKEAIEIVEILRGDYLELDDIIRYEDDYGRGEIFETPGQIYQRWLHSHVVDATSKRELEKFADDPEAIDERFGAELSFGTGGLRGIIGIGMNRMNVYVVRKATQGLANFINKQHDGEERPRVAIAYDTRYHSWEFAEEAALVLAANGIKAYIFNNACPTPQLSFAVRELHCAAGIVITASHNPPQYNGYKVYEPNGGQAVSPFIDGLSKAIEIVDIFNDVHTTSLQKAVDLEMMEVIGLRLDELYVENIYALTLSDPRQMIGVVFAPLHGTCFKFVPRLLKQARYVELFVVERQMIADPDFPTVESPNPEDERSYGMALDLARQKNADLVMATDPDCDRLGCAIRDDSGDYHLLSGNQTGALLLGYVLERLHDKNQLPDNGVMLKTIVTDDLGMEIAASYGIQTIETLTGFKYIGEKIEEFEMTGSHKFLFGYEESQGYLVGTFARDKDANIASVLIAEMTAYYKERGQNLLQVLEDYYREFGYHKSELVSLELKDELAADELMTVFKEKPPQIKGMEAVEKRDYSLGKSQDLLTGQEKKLTLPHAKVLYYRFGDRSWFCVRPSGTEPKIKFYFSAVASSNEEAETKLSLLKDAALGVVKGQQAGIGVIE